MVLFGKISIFHSYVDIKYEWENTDFTEFPEHP